MMCHKNRQIKELRQALRQLVAHEELFLKTHVSNREGLRILIAQAKRALGVMTIKTLSCQVEIFRERNEQLHIDLKIRIRQVLKLLDEIDINENDMESLEKWRKENGLSEVETTAGGTIGDETEQGSEKSIGDDSEKGEKEG